MGDDPAPAPAAPDYAAANTAGVVADVNTLGARRTIDQAARLGQKGSVYIPGVGNQNYDFTGLGDGDLTKSQTKSEGEAADARAAYSLGLQQKYGKQFVDLQTALTKASDPARAALSDDYMSTVKSDYDKGAELDDATRREVQQGARGAQAARGNILGDSSAYAETMALGQAGEARKAQRQAATQATLGLTPISGQFGSINQATGPVQVNSQLYTGQTTNPGAGAAGAQFALGSYGQQSTNWANTPANPWMGLAATGLGIGSSLGAAAL